MSVERSGPTGPSIPPLSSRRTRRHARMTSGNLDSTSLTCVNNNVKQPNTARMTSVTSSHFISRPRTFSL
ncbi:hypothetical protein SAMN05216259_105183 [Actinacidiphila guanduensis]|uniref:Uncharacterized protein n=1 Tax=Actinacidiphila guanduensis TaxID=310781 RepID=A0A1H0DE66_9ACTN|nr:hypothetical protein SAMN05216259_105183 [Actinacidiphila guanduensis]